MLYNFLCCKLLPKHFFLPMLPIRVRCPVMCTCYYLCVLTMNFMCRTVKLHLDTSALHAENSAVHGSEL